MWISRHTWVAAAAGMAVLLTACKTQEVVTGEARRMKPKELIKEVNANAFKAPFMSATAKVSFEESLGLPGVKAAIRMKQDEVIWTSITKLIAVGKAMITPDSIQGVSTLDRTYLEEPFDYLQTTYGIAADFVTLQKLLLAQLPITDHRTATAEVVDNSHRLEAAIEGVLYTVTIAPGSFQIQHITMTEENSTRRLDVSYSDFKITDGGPFPHVISITVSGDTPFGVEFVLSNVETPASLDFPFRIPAGYTRR
jgi:hypothetical protein